MVRPGMLISDRYEIIEKVGSGGMADVYKAKCHRLNRFVAIKVLKAEYSEDENFVDKFRGEAQSAAGLSHPNIVNVYDVGDDDGLHYIVMELVEGITLKSFIERKGKLEVKEALGISIQIAQGMEAAHANHIIHRDIKPQNIIISREGKVKVTDFGIAKAATSNTITSNAMGSVHYISPEQARGGYCDEKSDIYSLGITMYEMLTGRVPFTGDNTISVALLHIQGEATPLRDLEPSIPISIDMIVQKCMQKKPERRYTSVSELIKDLRRAITNPNDDFVKIPPMMINDSPTIHISDDEINHIKSVTKENPTVLHEEDELLSEEQPDDEDYEDDDDEDDVDPKVEKMMVIGGAVAGIVLIGIIVFVVFKIFAGGNDKEELVLPSAEPSVTQEVVTPEPTVSEETKVVVPNVVGKTVEEAERLLKEADIQYAIEKEYNSSYQEGYVFSVNPSAQTEITPSTKVTIQVSKGEKLVSMIDVGDMPFEKAERDLQEKGFAVKKETMYSESVAEGNVVKTDPTVGTEVSAGTTVTVYVSLGRENVYVPDLTNLTKEQAETKLQEAGLSLGKTTYMYSDNYKEGIIFEQDYSVNSKVKEGTAINVKISLGANKTYKYYGSAVISYNPFEFEDESGLVEIYLTQENNSKVVFSEECTYGDFPLSLDDVEGYNETNGTLTMYVDGEAKGDSVSISFTKVEQ